MGLAKSICAGTFTDIRECECKPLQLDKKSRIECKMCKRRVVDRFCAVMVLGVNDIELLNNVYGDE